MAGKTPRTPSTRPRPTARDVAEQADRILADALKRERDYKRKGMSSVTLPRDELIRKLRGQDRPLAVPHPDRLGQSRAGIDVRAELRAHEPGPVAVRQREPRPVLLLLGCRRRDGARADALLRAEPSVGIRQVDLGTLNTAPMPYLLSANHTIPAGFRVGPADLDYFLYTPDSWAAGVLLMRGTIRLDVA